VDTDSDGIGNNADLDDDGDMWPDAHPDWAPLDSTEWIDSDGDGIGNTADSDDDNDGTPDESDAYPYDSDNDGWGDAFEAQCDRALHVVAGDQVQACNIGDLLQHGTYLDVLEIEVERFAAKGTHHRPARGRQLDEVHTIGHSGSHRCRKRYP